MFKSFFLHSPPPSAPGGNSSSKISPVSDHLPTHLFTIHRIPVPVSVAKRRSAVPNDAISCPMGLLGGTTSRRRPGRRFPGWPPECIDTPPPKSPTWSSVPSNGPTHAALLDRRPSHVRSGVAGMDAHPAPFSGIKPGSTCIHLCAGRHGVRIVVVDTASARFLIDA